MSTVVLYYEQTAVAIIVSYFSVLAKQCELLYDVYAIVPNAPRFACYQISMTIGAVHLIVFEVQQQTNNKKYQSICPLDTAIQSLDAESALKRSSV